MTVVAIHQPQYLPWLPYCAKADACDVFIYLDDVQYQKNGMQNRNRIQSYQGPLWLSVPVHASLKNTIRETRIAGNAWRNKHVRSLQQAYAKAKHGAWLDHGLRKILERDGEFLADLNIAVTEWLFERLGVVSKRVRAFDLQVKGEKEERVLALCKAVGGTVYLSGQGARNYQHEATFQRQGITLKYLHYRNQPYGQCCPKTGFTPDLSALDLILNRGAEAREVMLAGHLDDPLPLPTPIRHD